MQPVQPKNSVWFEVTLHHFGEITSHHSIVIILALSLHPLLRDKFSDV